MPGGSSPPETDHTNGGMPLPTTSVENAVPTLAVGIPFVLIVRGNCAIAPTTLTTMLAVPDFIASAFDLARTTKLLGEGLVAGEVYTPSEVILPQAPPSHPSPDSDQATSVVATPSSFAEKLVCEFSAAFRYSGETTNEVIVVLPAPPPSGGGDPEPVEVPELPEPQPEATIAHPSTTKPNTRPMLTSILKSAEREEHVGG
jgi:hypothetical protein